MALRLSIRWRLTLWNASVLALLLVIFALAGWLTLALALKERADETVVETARAVAAAVIAERNAARRRGDVAPEARAAARVALPKLRAGDLDIIVSDAAARVVATSRGTRVPPSRGGGRGVGRAAREASASSLDTNTVAPPVRALMRAAGTDQPVIRTLQLEDGARRAASIRVSMGTGENEPALIVAVLRSVDDDEILLARTRTTLLLAIPLALGVSVLAGYALARRSLAPVEAMAEQASRISAANLESRVPVVNAHDELGRLATVINDLLARVDSAFRRQRLFVAEASHELRTPIAIVRGEADVTLQRASREESEYRESLGVIREETGRLTRIVNELFLLASADAGAPLATYEAIDLDELATSALRSVRSIADARGIVLVGPQHGQHGAEASRAHHAGTGGNGHAPTVMGDRTLLRRLVLNLLDNALKHAPDGGRVAVETSHDQAEATLLVSDNGPGVPPELRARIFDRFVRGARERAGLLDESGMMNESALRNVSSGAGLGLAIAEAIATLHRGRLGLDDTDHGARFRLVLPIG